MRFMSAQDYQMVLHFNKELVNVAIDTNIIIYKPNATNTETNIYGEAKTKQYYTGVVVSCLIDRSQFVTANDNQILDVFQNVNFSILRKTLEEKNIYPQRGDFIEFHNDYYEIDNVNETQLVAGQTEFNHSIICSCHLTRNTIINIERVI